MRFRLWCVENGYTAKRVEDVTGISKNCINAYWQGKRKPTRAREKVLIDKLGIPSGLFDD